MDTHNIRAHVERLNNARHYYQTECRQRAANESTINDWLLSYMQPRIGQLLGTGLSTPSTTHISREDDESTAEFEFNWWDPIDEVQSGLELLVHINQTKMKTKNTN